MTNTSKPSKTHRLYTSQSKAARNQGAWSQASNNAFNDLIISLVSMAAKVSRWIKAQLNIPILFLSLKKKKKKK